MQLEKWDKIGIGCLIVVYIIGIIVIIGMT